MFVRSQCKTKLLDIKSVIICTLEIKGIDNNGVYWRLGEYFNRNEAMEILDKIQEHLEWLLNEGVYNLPFNILKVFNMPESNWKFNKED
jgi:hypothetical protein